MAASVREAVRNSLLRNIRLCDDRFRLRRIVVLSFCILLVMEAFSAPKFIYAGWDLGDATPEEVLRMADAFDRSPCDGVALNLSGGLPGTDALHPRRIMHAPVWRYSDVAVLEPVFRSIASHRSLRESMPRMTLAPTNRLSWTDDRAWAVVATNLAVTARLVRRGGLKGIITDFEDYHRKKQFRLQTSDGAGWKGTLELARQRGRETFGAVFREFPDAVIFSFQLFSVDRDYADRSDPIAVMESKRDLWPAFVNGILDVMPPQAKLVDGCESMGYLARSSRGDFYRALRAQLVGVMPLVDEKNRAKYRAQMSASFGLYVDSYCVGTNSSYYFGPVRGRRITHLEENLRQAVSCADEYVWFWGERGFFIDWPADLKEKSGDKWRSTGRATWRRKYFNRRRGDRVRPWRETLDGDFDLILQGVKDPAGCVLAARAQQKKSGTFTNLMKRPLQTGRHRLRTCRVSGIETDAWYGVAVRARGEVVRLRAHFRDSKGWRWDLGSFQGGFSAPAADGWREGTMLVRVPPGATTIFFHLDSGETKQTVEFENMEVFKIQ